jgi:tetratricopeptide (TPR) repeat protein
MATTADPISYAAESPEGSLFDRHILEAALSNSASLTPDEIAEAKALLANVLMNDYLNWWNKAGKQELTDADKWVSQVLPAAPPPPPNPILALAYHARGLVKRAQGDGNGALADFQQAVRQDPKFARAHAQLGNQTARLNQPANSHAHFDDARKLAPNHPAIGYFDWGDGRAYFQEAASASSSPDWSKAIDLLKKSVCELPMVWYNRCYLAAAQDAAKDSADADKTMTDFLNDPEIDQSTYPRIVPSLQPNSNDPSTVAVARKRVLDFVHPKYL